MDFGDGMTRVTLNPSSYKCTEHTYSSWKMGYISIQPLKSIKDTVEVKGSLHLKILKFQCLHRGHIIPQVTSFEIWDFIKHWPQGFALFMPPKILKFQCLHRGHIIPQVTSFEIWDFIKHWPQGFALFMPPKILKCQCLYRGHFIPHSDFFWNLRFHKALASGLCTIHASKNLKISVSSQRSCHSPQWLLLKFEIS
jgi:hypothetical protein